MKDEASDKSLFDRLAEGDEEAARDLFHRYSERLSRLAQRHIHHKLAGRVDGEDVVQSVFRTFFERTARGEFRVDPSGDLWRLLVSLTLTKVRRQARRHQAQKRDVAAELPLNSEDWAEEMLAQEPSQLEALALVERMEKLLQGLSETHAQILSLLLENHSRSDIARELGLSRSTVLRASEVFKGRLRQLLAEEQASSSPLS